MFPGRSPLCNSLGRAFSSLLRALFAGTLAVAAGACGTGPGAISGGLVVTTIASGLDIPWAMAFVPDGRLFVTERPGRLRVIAGGVLQAAPVVTLPVEAVGEGGLLGLAADPAFATNGRLYVYYTYRSGASLFNRVARLAVSGSSAVQDRVHAVRHGARAQLKR